MNLRPGPENKGIWKRRDLSAAPAMPMAMATTAATAQTASQPPALGWRTANRAANTATTPISTPPLPGTAVNDPARSNVRRMYFRLSMACSCSSTGSVRGVAITLDDSAVAVRFQVLFDIKKRVRAAAKPGDRGEKPPRGVGSEPRGRSWVAMKSPWQFFMSFRGPKAHPNRVEKPPRTSRNPVPAGLRKDTPLWTTLLNCWREPEGGILSHGGPPQVRALRAPTARLGAPAPDTGGEFLYLLRPDRLPDPDQAARKQDFLEGDFPRAGIAARKTGVDEATAQRTSGGVRGRTHRGAPVGPEDGGHQRPDPVRFRCQRTGRHQDLPGAQAQDQPHPRIRGLVPEGVGAGGDRRARGGSGGRLPEGVGPQPRSRRGAGQPGHDLLPSPQIR